MLVARLAPLCALALAAIACGRATANATTGAPDALDAGVVGPQSFDAGPAFCAASGPPIALPGATPQCTGDVASRTFLYAVCACRNVLVSGTLTTDSLATASSDGTGGSIGANGTIAAQADLDVRGALWAAGQAGSPALHTVKSGTIFGDVHAGADVVADAPLTIDGALFLAPGASVSGATAASTIASPVAPPCDCSAPLPIASIVAPFASDNDDALAGVTPASLAPPTAPSLTLPCGRYYFDAIDADALSLTLTGRTAIFVAGGAAVRTSLAIALAPGAELDLFVAGDVALHDATIGDESSPARARVYVGGDTFTLDGAAHLGVNLYAPRADVQLAGDQRMAGSLFVGSLALSGAFAIHYDESILDAEGCAPSPPACVQGSACSTDADCCAPLACRGNRCAADVR